MPIAFPGKHFDTYEFIYNLSINSSGFRCGWFGCWQKTEPLLALLASKSLSNSWQPTKVVHKISVSLGYCHFEQRYRSVTLWNSLTCVCIANKNVWFKRLLMSAHLQSLHWYKLHRDLLPNSPCGITSPKHWHRQAGRHLGYDLRCTH